MEDKLTVEQLEEVLTWVDKFDLSKPSKYLNRDFSDGVLVAEILKKIFPKLVELHNYAPRCSIKLKITNWMTLNRKVLKKLDIFLTIERIQQLAESKSGCIELLLYEIMTKSREFLLNSSRSSSVMGDDDTNTDIMMVNVNKRTGDKYELLKQKMIVYSMYEDLRKESDEKDQAIAILSQKNSHLENLLKLKTERIEELQNQMTRRNQSRSELNLNEFYDIDPSSVTKE